MSPDETESMFQALEARLEGERGFRGWLRARPTWQRVGALTLIASLIVFGMPWVMRGHPPFVGRPLGAVASALTLLALAALALRASLRPLHRLDRWGPIRGWLLLGAVGTALIAIALASNGSFGGLGQLRCAAVGAIAATPVFFAGWWLDRAPWRGLLFGAAGAGLVGMTTVQLLCPADGLLHLWGTHFLGASVAGLLFALVGWRRALAG